MLLPQPAILLTPHIRYKKIFDKGSQLGAKLIDDKFEGLGTPEILDLISQVWVEMLRYLSYQCSAHSHAKHLNNSGELITIVAFLMEQGEPPCPRV